MDPDPEFFSDPTGSESATLEEGETLPTHTLWNFYFIKAAREVHNKSVVYWLNLLSDGSTIRSSQMAALLGALSSFLLEGVGVQLLALAH